MALMSCSLSVNWLVTMVNITPVAVTLLSLIFASLFNDIQSQDQCYVEGQCDGVTTGTSRTNGYNECLQLCKEDDNCNWLTFKALQRQCVKLFDCGPIIPCLEGPCYTGEKICDPRVPVCEEQGICQGTYVDAEIRVSYRECHRFCEETDNCLWFSFNPSNSECLLTQECSAIDTSCSDCSYGERECQDKLESTTLLVVGGNGAGTSVEIVDLSGQNRTCPRLPATPIYLGSAGTFIDDKIMISGGYGSTNKSYTFDVDAMEWIEKKQMNFGRNYPAGVKISENMWWVTGGLGSNMTTEIYSPIDDVWTQGADLPEGKFHHNLVLIDSNRIFLTGGTGSTRSWIFSLDTETFEELPQMTNSRYRSHAGLVINDNDELEIVVAGGEFEKSTEIFSLTSRSWRSGPDLPIGDEVELFGGASVQYGNGFLIVGGYIYGPKWQDTIFRYNPSGSGSWELLPQTLQSGRHDFAAFLIPDDLFDCQMPAH